MGGTIGCAWSICQALPDWSHSVFCCWPGEAPERTRAALREHALVVAPAVTAEALRRIAPDVILLHNVHDVDLPPEILPAGVPVFFYCHGSYDGRLAASAGLLAASWEVFFVSEDLARQVGRRGEVWYQPVPPPPAGPARPDGGPLVVGRLCNPRAENWFPELIDFYARLAERCPGVRWEFVGCPEEWREALAAACGDAAFLPAGLEARAHLHRWHAMLYHTRAVHAYGRTVCEAQQAGCVPVVDRRGGFVEQVEHGRTGYLCVAEDDFAAALAELADGERWRACSIMAREAGLRRGSPARWRERFLDLCRIAA